MKGDDIKEQIEALRQEVLGLSTSILNLRQDDMRMVFGDQSKSALNDRIVRHYAHAQMGRSTERERLSEQKLLGLVDRTVTIFQQHGKQRALNYLDKHRQEWPAHSENEGGADRFESEMTAQLRDYLLLSDTVIHQTAPEGSSLDPMGTYLENRTLSPDAAERLLAPMSNAKRVQVMLILSRESSNLAELCRELDLQKGHLQFHIKALLDVEYIRFDRKSRLYSITPRGKKVMNGVAKIVESLSSE